MNRIPKSKLKPVIDCIVAAMKNNPAKEIPRPLICMLLENLDDLDAAFLFGICNVLIHAAQTEMPVQYFAQIEDNLLCAFANFAWKAGRRNFKDLMRDTPQDAQDDKAGVE